MRCQPGDLAVVIDAHTPSNIGKIVKVIEPYNGKGDIVLPGQGPQWLVRCSGLLAWSNLYDAAEILHIRHEGPAFDRQLQPIRRSPALDDAEARMNEKELSAFESIAGGEF